MRAPPGAMLVLSRIMARVPLVPADLPTVNAEEVGVLLPVDSVPSDHNNLVNRDYRPLREGHASYQPATLTLRAILARDP